MHSFGESIVYYLVRALGAFFRLLPAGVALQLARGLGFIGYYCDFKHRRLAYTNLKIAFAKTKSPREIKQVTRRVFQNYAQSFVELLRLPLGDTVEKFIKIEGR